MSEETETIRQDIASIRDSMTDKMEQIESRVRGTVDTTVETVGKIFDPRQQVNDHPWAALGLAALTGYLLGSMGGERAPARAPRPGEPVRYYYDNPRDRPTPAGDRPGQGPKLVGELADQFGDELQLISAAATSAAMGMLRETIKGGLSQFGSEPQPEPASPREQWASVRNDAAEPALQAPLRESPIRPY